MLKKHNRALCVAETEERVTPDVMTADFCYYRYRKPEYTPEERQAMVASHAASIWAQDATCFAYFKHEETPQGAIYAVDVLKEARQPRRSQGHGAAASVFLANLRIRSSLSVR